jgi:nitrate reductase delta subunit
MSADPTAVVLQAASVLLDYPSGEGAPATGTGESSGCCATLPSDDLDLVAAAVGELPAGAPRRHLELFLQGWRGLSAGERERRYVTTFELGAAASLYLTEGRTPGERGAALPELRRAYGRHGADVTPAELPDFLPLMLEVAAHVAPCRRLLEDERAVLERIAGALERRDSPFVLVLRAVLAALPAGGGQ